MSNISGILTADTTCHLTATLGLEKTTAPRIFTNALEYCGEVSVTQGCTAMELCVPGHWRLSRLSLRDISRAGAVSKRTQELVEVCENVIVTTDE